MAFTVTITIAPTVTSARTSTGAPDHSGPRTRPFPAEDPGLPALGIEALLDAHAELIKRIKVCFGVDRETFEQEVMTLVRRYTAFVHLLPATPDNYFSDPGGLLQLGLETAFFALQGTDAHIFSGRATITVRRHLEPRWRLATFIGGLCSEIPRTMSRLSVMDALGHEWPAYLTALQPWLQSKTAARYFLKWRPSAPAIPGFALYALPHIVPAATLQHLAEANTTVVPHLMACLSGTPLPQDHNILDALVRRSAALVIDRFLRERADRTGKPQLGAHLHRYLLDAMRRLVATDPAWLPNAERSRVWLGADGLFIAWPGAAADLRKLLEADRLPGAPKAAETMQDILMSAGLLQARADGQGLWAIHPPGSKAPVEALKMSAPGLMLAGLSPAPRALPQTLAVPATASLPRDPPHSDDVFKPLLAADGAEVALDAPGQPKTPGAHQIDGSGAPSGSSSSQRQLATLSETSARAMQNSGMQGASSRPATLRTVPDAPEQLELSSSWGTERALAGLSRSEPMAGDAAQPSAHEQTPPHALPVSSTGGASIASSDTPVERPQAIPDPAVNIAARTVLSLNAPLRLAPAVRGAIDAVIGALNDTTSSVDACFTPAGLFITLEALDGHGIPPPIAIRALADAGMLAEGRASTTMGSQTGPVKVIRMAGHERRGLVIARAFVEGVQDWTALSRELVGPPAVARSDPGSDIPDRPKKTSSPNPTAVLATSATSAATGATATTAANAGTSGTAADNEAGRSHPLNPLNPPNPLNVAAV